MDIKQKTFVKDFADRNWRCLLPLELHVEEDQSNHSSHVVNFINSVVHFKYY